jgi:hypothetical protein
VSRRSRSLTLILALMAGACRGPRPAVVSSALLPAHDGGSILVVMVENSGGGEGEVEVEATLRSDRHAVRLERDVKLRAHERLRVDFRFDLPADGSYRPEVEVRYPID